jgi:mono/diheme cytochrome c family protein
LRQGIFDMNDRAIYLTAIALFALLFVPPAAADDGLAAWGKIVGVLKHPRCMNCHQATSPLQGDAGSPHIPFVVRGPNGTGTSGMRCGTCHKDSGNDPMSGTPGAKDWKLAPVSMVWQGKTSAELCAMLKDPKTNGGRDGDALIKHMDVEPLVLWGWSPGPRRTPVPLAHKDLIAAMHQWVAGGMPCPK